MSRQQFFSKYLAEKALSMLGEDSDNSESDDESSDVDVDETDLEEIRSTLFDQEMPSPEDNSSDEDNELDDSSSTGKHFKRNREIWIPLLSSTGVPKLG